MKFRRRVHVYVTEAQEEALRKHLPDKRTEEAISVVLDFLVEDHRVADDIRAELAELRAREADA